MAKRKKSNRLLYILLAVVAVLVIAAVAAKSAGIIGQPEQIEVELAEADLHTIVEKVNASGMIQPETEVQITPDVPGEIIELLVKEGDSVVRGDLLIKIRPDNFQSALARVKANYNQQKANLSSSRSRLAQAEAQFEKAKSDFERSEKLYKQNVISDADFDQARATYRVAEEELQAAQQNVEAARYMVESAGATVKEAQENLDLTSVHAPVSGTISKLSVEEGERVVGTSQMAGTEMMRIADLNRMEVQVDVNENDIIRVSLGDTAIIDVDSYAHMDRQFKGVVTAIANTANAKVSPEAVTEFEVKVRILNSSFQDLIEEEGMKIPFRPGMTASVEIITNKKENVLSVPLAAVTTRSIELEDEGDAKRMGGADMETEDPKRLPDVEDEIEEVVFVYKDGVANMVNVKTGISDYEFIEIIEGLEQGQEVVAGPYLVVSKRLEEGDLIKPLELEEEKEIED
ncbi:efflux RND transporter periplasmic adaptor subunit [Nafulsella turpanensis]|uniref:efflux RND transporter periplasmic adaptor subunit n=1 Tax=Nafulsella turpanensis TaxID=1265690 RepID=UPI00034C9BBD|nr:efflux RND transporter periplasmic adaptor subunit [Nafulsella turpanensis]